MYFCNRVVVQAPAKVNLALNITGRDPDGYHSLDGVMLTVDLCDVLILSRTGDEGIVLNCSRPGIPLDADNTAHKAAEVFFAHSGLPAQGLRIHIDKTIPAEAGLAGGSADAAGVLVALNRLYQADLSTDRLCEMALEVGADVPFCVRGGCARARGRGERMEPQPMPPACWLVVAKPPVSMSTRYAFKLYDEQGAGATKPNVFGLMEALEAGDLRALGASMCNVFEEVTPLDEVELLKGILLVAGALGAVMTGSGTAVCGLFDDERAAKLALRRLREQVPEAFLVHPVSHGARILYAGN